MTAVPGVPSSPRGSGYVDGLTGVRALAALWVFAHHLNAIVGPRVVRISLPGIDVDVTPLLTCGWVGVDIFFVLSGFLLTRQLLDACESGDARGVNRRFLLHRVLRVYPAYLAQIAVLAALAWVAAGAPPAWLRHLPLHLVMLQSVTPASEPAINGVYWTLTAEFWFYLLLPFVVAALHAAARRSEAALGRRALAVYLGAILLMVAYRGATVRAAAADPALSLEWTSRQLPATIDVFAAGMLAAVGSRFIARGAIALPRGASGAMLAGGLAGIVWMLYVMHERFREFWAGGALFLSWHAVTALFAALMILGISLDGRLSRAAFANAPARYLGEASYSIYLWHLPAALWVATVLPPASGEARYVAAAFAAALLASLASYHAVERPVLRRRGLVERRLLGLAGG